MNAVRGAARTGGWAVGGRGVAVSVGVRVSVEVLVSVGVAVWVGVRVKVGVGVFVGVRVRVGVGVRVDVRVLVAVSVAVLTISVGATAANSTLRGISTVIVKTSMKRIRLCIASPI